jgi:hypothetical protein
MRLFVSRVPRTSQNEWKRISTYKYLGKVVWLCKIDGRSENIQLHLTLCNWKRWKLRKRSDKPIQLLQNQAIAPQSNRSSYLVSQSVRTGYKVKAISLVKENSRHAHSWWHVLVNTLWSTSLLWICSYDERVPFLRVQSSINWLRRGSSNTWTLCRCKFYRLVLHPLKTNSGSWRFHLRQGGKTWRKNGKIREKDYIADITFERDLYGFYGQWWNWVVKWDEKCVWKWLFGAVERNRHRVCAKKSKNAHWQFHSDT